MKETTIEEKQWQMKWLSTKTQSGWFVWEGILPTRYVRKMVEMTEAPLFCYTWMQNNGFSIHLKYPRECMPHNIPAQQYHHLWSGGVFFVLLLFFSSLNTHVVLCLWGRTRAALRLGEQLAALSNINERDGKTVQSRGFKNVRQRRRRRTDGDWL